MVRLRFTRRIGFIIFVGFLNLLLIYQNIPTFRDQLTKQLFIECPASNLTYKVAFVGDTGASKHNGSDDQLNSLLKLIKEEGTQILLHQGDWDYTGDTIATENLLRQYFGDSIIVIGSIGNYERHNWKDYQLMQERLNVDADKYGLLNCKGPLGLKSYCRYSKLGVVNVGVGIVDDDTEDYTPFIAQSFGETCAPRFKFCSFHVAHQLFRVTPTSIHKIPLKIYEQCRKQGAVIVNGHEHYYLRSHPLVSFDPPTVIPFAKSGRFTVSNGVSFTFTSGLGGRSVDGQVPELVENKWWKKTYTNHDNAVAGALFCTLDEFNSHVDCYFKTIDGTIVDSFEYISS